VDRTAVQTIQTNIVDSVVLQSATNVSRIHVEYVQNVIIPVARTVVEHVISMMVVVVMVAERLFV
jgi:hypothetical protein